ncbi:MAG: hypothetical protein OHK0039_45750 [Bacteroidia bacterium]
MTPYTYLLLDLGTLFFPLVLSFDRKVAFFKGWGALFPAIVFSGGIFVIWDVLFTRMGIWSFNDTYLVGARAAGLPLEEWGFFIVVPYACVFIYACLKAYFPKLTLTAWRAPVGWGLVALLVLVGVLYIDRWYTAVTALGLVGWLVLNLLWIRPVWLGRFFLAYLIGLLPFALVNGVLTALPVVQYNDLENLGIRLGTIPVEDIFYGMLLILMTVNAYEYLLDRWLVRKTRPKLQHA